MEEPPEDGGIPPLQELHIGGLQPYLVKKSTETHLRMSINVATIEDMNKTRSIPWEFMQANIDWEQLEGVAHALNWRPISAKVQIANVRTTLDLPSATGKDNIPVPVHDYALSVLDLDGDDTITPFMYPFAKVDQYHSWNDTLKSSKLRQYKGTCPERTVAGNTWWKLSGKIDRLQQQIPIQDSRWTAMNPVVNTPFMAKEFYMKAHWWRGMDELFRPLLQTVPIPMVPWKDVYSCRNAEYPKATKVQFVEGLLSSRFDGYAGDVTMPRYGLQHIWRASVDKVTHNWAPATARLCHLDDVSITKMVPLGNHARSSETYAKDQYPMAVDEQVLLNHIHRNDTTRRIALGRELTKTDKYNLQFDRQQFQPMRLDDHMTPLLFRCGTLTNKAEHQPHYITFDVILNYEMEFQMRKTCNLTPTDALLNNTTTYPRAVRPYYSDMWSEVVELKNMYGDANPAMPEVFKPRTSFVEKFLPRMTFMPIRKVAIPKVEEELTDDDMPEPLLKRRKIAERNALKNMDLNNM